MKRDIIKTDKAPAAIGPYSQAVRCNGFLFCSGQIALDPATGQVIPGGVAEQAEQVMKNLSAVLEAAGCGWEQVVKTTIFLATMDDFAAVNEVYGRYLGQSLPARATVAAAGLPKGVLVEVEAVAACPEA
jgi:2-iminobutanoate/2-iminopropanoate deaminase